KGEAPGLGCRAVRRGDRARRHGGGKAPRAALRAGSLRVRIGSGRLQCCRSAGSSNGRTPDSGSGSLGSSPSPAAGESPAQAGFLFTEEATGCLGAPAEPQLAGQERALAPNEVGAVALELRGSALDLHVPAL